MKEIQDSKINFTIEVGPFKKVVEQLIQKKYLIRKEEEPNILIYQTW